MNFCRNVLNLIIGKITINCGNTISDVTVPGTVITSPNHPHYYPNNQNCSTVIRFSQERRVLLTFLAFNLDGGTGCNYDWLEIRDGDNANASLIGQILCGNQRPGHIISKGSALYIYFHTDDKGVGSGFEIKVDAAAGKSYCTKYNTLFLHNL